MSQYEFINELNLFNVAILILLYHVANISKTKIKYQEYFNNSIYSTIVLCILDTIISITPSNYPTFGIIVLLYYMSCTSIIYRYFYYTCRLIHFNPFRLKFPYKYIFFIPVIVYFITYYNTNININPGIAFIVSILGISIYCIGRVVNHVTTKNKFYMDRLKFIMFPVLPVSGIMLSPIFSTSAIICSATISCILYYIQSIHLFIYTDSLTQINNRYYLLDTITDKIKRLNKDNSELYLMMIDVDNFKEINDTYGHIEGDKCLIRLAEVIKISCSSLLSKSFICRYGGDEFLIVTNCTNDKINKLKCTIDRTLEEKNLQNNCRYDFKISIGISKYNPIKHDSIDAFINDADNELYEIKAKNKALRV